MCDNLYAQPAFIILCLVSSAEASITELEEMRSRKNLDTRLHDSNRDRCYTRILHWLTFTLIFWPWCELNLSKCSSVDHLVDELIFVQICIGVHLQTAPPCRNNNNRKMDQHQWLYDCWWEHTVLHYSISHGQIICSSKHMLSVTKTLHRLLKSQPLD